MTAKVYLDFFISFMTNMSYEVLFTLKRTNVQAFTPSISVKQFPRVIGREDFQLPTSDAQFVSLNQISRVFFTIDASMNVQVSEKNNTHFAFRDQLNRVVPVKDNGFLTKPLEDDFTLEIAEYTIESGILVPKSFRQRSPTIYNISLIDLLGFDDDTPFKVKRQKKEAPDLVCPYCEKMFKQLSYHIRVCKQRPSDVRRPEPDERGFIPKKRLWNSSKR